MYHFEYLWNRQRQNVLTFEPKAVYKDEMATEHVKYIYMYTHKPFR